MKIQIAGVTYKSDFEMSEKACMAIETEWEKAFDIIAPEELGSAFEPPVAREVYVKNRLYAAHVDKGDIFIDGHDGALCKIVPAHGGVVGQKGSDTEDGLVRQYVTEDGKDSLVLEKRVFFYDDIMLTIPLLALVAAQDHLGASSERTEIDALLNAITDGKTVFTGGGIVNPERKKKVEQKSIRLQEDVHANSILSQKIGRVPFEETNVSVDLSFREEKQILAGISLHYDGEGVEISKPISEYDKAVLNSIASCWEAGFRKFTPQQLYAALYGKTTRSPSPNAISEITESIEKLRRTRVTLDCTDEFAKRKVKIDGDEIKSAVFNDYMLSARAIKMKTLNGRQVDAYEINAAPLLYVHDKAVKQLLRFPHALVESIGSELQATKNNLLLRDYVISRVLQCCKKSGADLLDVSEKLRFRYRRIKVEAILEAAGFSEDACGSNWGKKKTRAMKNIRQIFQKLYQENIIDEWSEIEEDGTVLSSFNRDTGMAEKFSSAIRKSTYAIDIVTFDDARERLRRGLSPANKKK